MSARSRSSSTVAASVTTILGAGLFAGSLFSDQTTFEPTASPVGSPTTGAAGRIAGTVSYAGSGSLDGDSPIDMSVDSYCAEQHAEGAVVAPTVRIDENGGIGGVVVHVKEGLSSTTDYPVPAEPAVLDQRKCIYHPAMLALRAGQTLLVRNSDLTLHNVNVSPRLNRGFNLGQPTRGIESRRSFREAELGIEVGCDVHDWMHASLAVFDHPFFAVTESDGSFTLEGLPPGEYVVEAWHDKLGSLSKTVVIDPSISPELEFTFR